VRQTLIEAGKLPVHTKVLLGGTDPKPFLKHSRLSKGKGVSKNRSLQLLYFGRLIHDKGVHTAIEALGLLNGQQTSDAVHFTILGSGHPQYEKKLREMVHELGIDDKVKFIAHIPRDKIPELLGSFDVFLFTSIWPEPMARSVMEAMAAGLLVIGTEVGGQMEMLNDGINSLTFKAEDANGLADQIARVIMDNSLMFDLADAGQKMVVEKFTLVRMVDEIEKFLMDIVNNTK
jgi:glycosyltransferase involved in cell wall biosynthesis